MMVNFNKRTSVFFFTVSQLACSSIHATTRQYCSSNSLFSTPVLALDFDGVVCASSLESSHTALIASERFWSDIIIPSYNRDIVQNILMSLRPVVETGYENMLLVRVIVDRMKLSEVNADDILKIWTPSFRDAMILDLKTSKDELVMAFGNMRDELISKDINHWIAMNEIYPPVLKTLLNRQKYSNNNNINNNLYIITTKQRRFVNAILQANQITPPPEHMLFDLDSNLGPKTKVLSHILSEETNKYSSSSTTTSVVPEIHFVEDRYETLISVSQTKGLESVKLYLADWGYNTKQQKEAAEDNPNITVIGFSEFEYLVNEIQTRNY